MNVVILGANGSVGSVLVRMALGRGHVVAAFVHGSANSLPKHKSLTIVHCDVHNKKDFKKIPDGTNAIISALGSWGTVQKDILSAAMHNLIPIAKQRSVDRVVTLTGADARASGDNNGIINSLTRPLLLLFAGKILRDSEKHIKLLQASDLQWTVLRSPVMRSGVENGYKLVAKRPYPWATIKRDDVAKALLDCVDNQTFVQQSPFIVNI